MPLPSGYDSNLVLKQPSMAYSGPNIVAYSGSLHGSAYLAVGSLVALTQPYPGGRLTTMIRNNYCDHKYEGWH